MKNNVSKPAVRSLVAACAMAATALSPIAAAPAAADGAYLRVEGGHSVRRAAPSCRRQHGHRVCAPAYNAYNRHRPPVRYRDDGDAVAAAILGLAAGALIVGTLSQAPRPVEREYYIEEGPYPAPNPYPRAYYPQANPYPPAPAAGPKVITYDSTLEPWTPAWEDWCSANFLTFNARTGTYHGYDGRDHFCVPK